MTYTGSKARKVQIESSSTMVAMTPRSAGQRDVPELLERRGRRRCPPPRTARPGIACRPASSITMKNGNARQMFIAVTERSDVSGLPSQLMVALGSRRPREASRPFTTPNGASISTQIMPATVGASSHGMISSAAHEVPDPALILACSRSARPSPMHEVQHHAARREQDGLPQHPPEERGLRAARA